MANKQRQRSIPPYSVNSSENDYGRRLRGTIDRNLLVIRPDSQEVGIARNHQPVPVTKNISPTGTHSFLHTLVENQRQDGRQFVDGNGLSVPKVGPLPLGCAAVAGRRRRRTSSSTAGQCVCSQPAGDERRLFLAYRRMKMNMVAVWIRTEVGGEGE